MTFPRSHRQTFAKPGLKSRPPARAGTLYSVHNDYSYYGDRVPLVTHEFLLHSMHLVGISMTKDNLCKIYSINLNLRKGISNRQKKIINTRSIKVITWKLYR